MVDEELDEMLIFDVVKNIINQLDELSPDYTSLLSNLRPPSTPQRSRHSTASSVDVFYLDECKAFLQQVPERFDLGTTPVNLNCLAVSPSYVVLGSDCGALFLYNRKINSSVRPLRTNYEEVVSCVQLYCSSDKDYLAVGHKSGTLILLSFPSGDSAESNRKLKQSIQEDIHRGQSISCVCWGEYGNKLFSADRTGLVMLCHVDFLNDQFISVFVCSVEMPVQALASSSCYLALATATSYSVFDIDKNCALILDSRLSQEDHHSIITIIGISFMYISRKLLLIVCSNSGQILAQTLEEKKEHSKQLDLLNLQFLVDKISSSSLSHNGSPSKKGSTKLCWTDEDFSISKTVLPTRPSENNLIYYSSDKVMFCSLLVQNDGKLNAKLEVFDFEQLLKDFEQFEIVDAASTEWKRSEEIFLLTSSQKVLRLAKTPVSAKLTSISSSTERPSVGVLFNSFSLVAQKSSRSLIEKIERFQNSQIANAGMQLVDNFLIVSSSEKVFKASEEAPIELTSKESSSSSSSSQQTRERKAKERKNLPFDLHKTFALPEDYSAKIASNFQNIFEHLKTSNLMSDYEKATLNQSHKNDVAHKKENPSNNQTYFSTTAVDSGALNDFDLLRDNRSFEYNGQAKPNEQETNVNVARKTRIRRVKLLSPKLPEKVESSVSSVASDLNALPTYLIQENETSTNENLAVPDRNLEKILGVIGLAEPLNLSSEVSKKSPWEYNYMSDAQPSASLNELSQVENLACDMFSSQPSPSHFPLIEKPIAEELDCDTIKLASDLFSDSASSSSNEVSVDNSKNIKEEEENTLETVEEIKLRSEGSTNIISSSFCRPEPEEEQLEAGKLANISDLLPSEVDFIVNCSPSVSDNSLFDQISSQTSSHTSSTSANNLQGLCKLNADYCLISRLVNHLTDIWSQLIAPCAIGQMDVSQNYIVICPDEAARGIFQRKQTPHYRLLNAVDNGVMGGSWTMLKANTVISSIAVNDESTLVWRISQVGKAFVPTEVDPFSPMSANSNWVEQTSGEGAILSVALTSKNAWYLTSKGVFVQMNLPEMGIMYRAECSFQLSQLAASESAVWALRADTGSLVVRMGIKHCPMGLDWVEDSLYGPRKFVSIALHQNSGFGLDFSGCLWLNKGVTETNPFGEGCWYQICSFNLLNMPVDSSLLKSSTKLWGSNLLAPINKWRIKVSRAGVFINVGRVIMAARQPLTGHLLSRVVPYRLFIHDNFSILSAGAFCGDSSDCIYVSQQLNSEIFLFSVKKRNFTSLPPFSESVMVIALSACRERLYLLDSCGSIHYRENAANNCFSADLTDASAAQSKNGWIKFCEDEIRTSVISFAASNTCIWAIDSFHRIFYVSIGVSSAWTEVDRPKQLPNEKIDQIRASPTGKYVWLFASKSGYSWARTGITETNPKGKSWIQACSDVRLDELAVAENAVWCLAKETKQLFRLRSLNLNNPAGHYWKPMNFSLKAISVDAVENRLWGLDMDNRIVRHEMQIYPSSCLDKKSTTISEERIADGWGQNSAVVLRKANELERISPDPLHSWCLLENNDVTNGCLNTDKCEDELRYLPYTTPVDIITDKIT